MIQARIQYLELRGFRRFQLRRDFTFSGPDERPPETLVLAGPNGSGKSSLFEAVLYALGREALLHSQLGEDHRRRWMDTALAADGEVVVHLDVTSAQGTVLGAYTPCVVEIARSRSGWTLIASTEGSPMIEDHDTIRQVLGELPVAWFSSWRQPHLPGPVRPMADVGQSARGESGRLWRIKQRIVDERARAAFRQIPGREEAWLDELNLAWAALRGEDGTRISVRPAGDDPDTQEFDLCVVREVEGLGEDVVCFVDQLSSGELEWLALVGTLITTGFKGIVLLDEPELHLHPEWQMRLLSALRTVAQESQIIMASHADPPWDQVYSFERVLLVPDDDPRARRDHP